MAESPEKKAVYFGSLTVEGVKCFKGKETLDLTDEDGKPAKLTVILGNNGTGKTTLLTCLLGMMPIKREREQHTNLDLNIENIVKHIPHMEAWPLRLAYRDVFPKFEGRTIPIYFKIDLEKKGDILERFGWAVDSKSVQTFFSTVDVSPLLDMKIWAYGAKRQMGDGAITEPVPSFLPFLSHHRLTNAEEYLIQIDLAHKNHQKKAQERWNQVVGLIKSFIKEIENLESDSDSEFRSFIKATTSSGEVPLAEMSLGFQSVLALVTDVAKKLIDSYPDSINPFNEPAVILIDEIDLHLHPSWQQRILNDLTTLFRHVQFIVTTHSPLVLQSAERVNLAVLHDGDQGVSIENYQSHNFQGWTVDEVLYDLMHLNKTSSQRYLDLSAEFERAIALNDGLAAKDAYDELDKMLHHASVKRQLMQIRMSALMPPEKV